MVMIQRIKQMLWRQRQLVVIMPEHDWVRAGVYSITSNGLVELQCELFARGDGAIRKKGLKSAEEWVAFVALHREESWILVLPPTLTISQALRCHASSPQQLETDLEQQAEKLSGLGNRHVILDHVLLSGGDASQSDYWVTYCQHQEINQIIDELDLVDVAICDVLSSHDAYWAALQGLRIPERPWLLIEVFDGSTSISLFDSRTPCLAHCFAMGAELARERGQRSVGPLRLGGSQSSLPTRSNQMVDGIKAMGPAWANEIARSIKEYLSRDGRLKKGDDQELACLLITGDSHQSIWEEQLEQHLACKFVAFEDIAMGSLSGLKVNRLRQFGACQTITKKNLMVPSLLPEAIKEAWDQRQVDTALRSAALAGCVLVSLMLLVAFAQKAVLWKLKAGLLDQLSMVEERVDQSLIVFDSLKQEYQMLQPLVHAEDQTMAVLKTLDRMQTLRTNGLGWAVLLADQETYYEEGGRLQEMAVGDTNAVPVVLTNRVSLQQGLILELVIDRQGESMRRSLEDLVGVFQASDYVVRADTLPSNTRRAIVSPDVLLPNQHFAISLELLDSIDQEQSAEAAQEGKVNWNGFTPRPDQVNP